MRHRITLLVAPFLLLALLPGAVSAAPQHDARAEHRAAVLAYWTPARMKAAVPFDYSFDAVRGFHEDKGRPGGGGGGGTPSSVGGASWNGGGRMLKSTGRVLFHLSSGDYICSGSVVDDGDATNNPTNNHAIVLTAGHCVTENTAGSFATNWLYIPSFDTSPTYTCSATTYGCWVADALYASTAFATAGGFNTQAIQNDWGFARVTTGGFDGSQLDYKLGSFPIQFASVASGTVLSSFGYPAAGKYNGSDLIYCRNAISYDALAGNATYGMTCDETGGASGGPWVQAADTTAYSDARLTSLNSYRYSGGTKMYGPKFNSRTHDVFDAADAGGTLPSGVSGWDLP